MISDGVWIREDSGPLSAHGGSAVVETCGVCCDGCQRGVGTVVVTSGHGASEAWIGCARPDPLDAPV